MSDVNASSTYEILCNSSKKSQNVEVKNSTLMLKKMEKFEKNIWIVFQCHPVPDSVHNLRLQFVTMTQITLLRSAQPRAN